MIGAQVVGGDLGEDEVFRWDGASEEPTEQRELACVGHGVRERSLKKDLGSDFAEFGAEFEVMSEVGEDFVKVLDGGGELGKDGRTVGATQEERAGVAEHAVHMAD